MTLPLEVHPDVEAAARRVAALVLERVTGSRSARHPPGPKDPPFALALSRALPALLDALAAAALPWERVVVYQVDERVAPGGSPQRNLTGLVEALPADRVRAMPVEGDDLERAAREYAHALPDRLDLVHLGLGLDGHTASLVPGDPVLDVRERAVAVTAGYEGFRRMTLTYAALEAAAEIVWLVTGEEKHEPLRRLLDRDPSIPAARIANPSQLIVADEAAAG